jgi:enamine deaminase RidA (YjgF/YER057c/UK114 family)
MCSNPAMATNPIADRLKQLGITLPTPPKPIAAYIPFVRTGNLLFVSGQGPFVDGKLTCAGAIPSAISVDQGRAAARQSALNALAIIADALQGDLSRVQRIVKLGVFVCSDPGFGDQPKVANGASELLQELFGEAGRHARAAVGSVALPMNMTVEVEMVVEVTG